MADFIGLLPTLNKRPRSPQNPSVVVRDSLHLSTWLCVGAALQSAAFLAIGRLAILPAIGFLAYRVIDAYATTTGLKRNPYMDNVIMGRFTAQFPDANGSYGNKPGNTDVAVLIIGTRSNHPLGILAPGFKEVGDYMNKMIKQLRGNTVEHGFLGCNSFMGTERSSNNTTMLVMYFRDAASVHAYAEGPLHRESVAWWNKHLASRPHIAIFHELYHVPKGHWENVYVQSAPYGITDTLHRVAAPSGGNGAVAAAGVGPGEEKREEVWMSPIVDARKGVLRSSVGRMGKQLDEKV